eukprot:XP_003725864.2 PREDICTED: uncharacterized protein LOC100892034 [Strongylocentrotus purpuratus]
MSGSSAVPSSISRLEEDGSQPSPKRRKNSSTKSRENGFNNISSNSEPTSSHPTTCPDATTTKGVDNGNIVSSTSTATTTTTSKERDTSTEATPKSVSGTEVVNGDVITKAENANEEKAESKSKSANGQTGAEKKDQSLRRNQFGEVSDGHMALEDWLEQWKKGKTRFTMKVPNRMLVKHYDKLVEGKTNPVFFLPCCGKSLDIKWLADKGHSVVGVEIAEMACRQFFESHDLKYEEEEIKDGPKGKLFKFLSVLNSDGSKATPSVKAAGREHP